MELWKPDQVVITDKYNPYLCKHVQEYPISTTLHMHEVNDAIQEIMHKSHEPIENDKDLMWQYGLKKLRDAK